MNKDIKNTNEINLYSSKFLYKAWLKKNALVEVYSTTGAKVIGILKAVDQYEIVLLDETTDKKFIIYKSNIFYMSKLKGVKNASVQ